MENEHTQKDVGSGPTMESAVREVADKLMKDAWRFKVIRDCEASLMVAYENPDDLSVKIVGTVYMDGYLDGAARAIEDILNGKLDLKVFGPDG